MSRFSAAILMTALLAAGAGAPGGPSLPRAPRPKPPPAPGPQRVPCPRCKAGVGEPCDRRTLGRHHYHRARLDALTEEAP